jgi:protein-histidine N-methyltransferase
VPTLLLLDRLFAFLASEIGGAPREPPETEIHLQDYNRAVLELVTFSNVVLAWCTFRLFDSSACTQTLTDVSPLSAQYRNYTSAPDADSDSDSDDTGHGRQHHERRPGALTVTPALLAAFRTSLDARRVYLRFFSGGWTSLRARLGIREVGRSPYDVVLASEMIYRTDALGPFLGVLRAATAASPQLPLCLIAAKVLYFGVGDGVQEFVRAAEEERGTVHIVWEHREGVGRRIMRVEW